MAKFQKGNPGRPKGARHKLTEAFWKDFAAAWTAHGRDALEHVAQNDPSTFLRVAANVMPREIEATVRHVTASEMSDDDLAAIAAGGSDGAAAAEDHPPVTH